MCERAEIYTLGCERTVEAITEFLDEFLPERNEPAGEFEVQQYAYHPLRIFSTVNALLDYCCEHSNVSHAVYWYHARENIPEGAMVFLLADGGIVFGISTLAKHTHRVDAISQKLEKWFQTEKVIVMYESLPPKSTKAFIDLFDSLPEATDKSSAIELRQMFAHRPIKV